MSAHGQRAPGAEFSFSRTPGSAAAACVAEKGTNQQLGLSCLLTHGRKVRPPKLRRRALRPLPASYDHKKAVHMYLTLKYTFRGAARDSDAAFTLPSCACRIAASVRVSHQVNPVKEGLDTQFCHLFCNLLATAGSGPRLGRRSIRRELLGCGGPVARVCRRLFGHRIPSTWAASARNPRRGSLRHPGTRASAHQAQAKDHCCRRASLSASKQRAAHSKVMRWCR